MTRLTIFAAVKAQKPDVWNDPGNIHAMDNLLDALGIGREGADPFDLCIAELWPHEGGFSNDPHDNGGMTNLGVTKRAWEEFVGHPVTESDMRSLTRVGVTPFYRKNYWDAVHGDELPTGLALCLFDMAVNSGPGRAVRTLQHALGVAQDGKVGPVTLGLVKQRDEKALIHAFQNGRREYLRGLDDFAHFGRGWMTRVDQVETRAMELAK